jgi:xylulokinase
MDSTGTVECVTLSTERLVLDRKLAEANLPVAASTMPGMYLVMGYSTAGGALLRWYRDNFGRLEVEEAGRTGRSVYELMLESLSPDPSPVLILPHFVGSGTPHMDPASKGAILGLDLSTTRDQLLKGILDSVTYEIKLSLDAMAEAGIRSRELRAIGGGARSARWLQTKADILGIPVVAMDVSEAPSLGAAILAGAATGAFPSVEQGIARMVHQRRTYEPDVTLGERYAERFALYQLVYPTLRDLNHAM